MKSILNIKVERPITVNDIIALLQNSPIKRDVPLRSFLLHQLGGVVTIELKKDKS